MRSLLILGVTWTIAIFSGGLLASARGEAGERGSYTTVRSKVGTVRLWSEEFGEGPPILMIHGFGSHLYTWRKVAPGLAKANRVILIDLKGSGRSDKPTDDRYGLHDHVGLLVDFIRKKDLHGLTLVGHSLGGGIALALSQQMHKSEPGRITKLVLVASMGYPQPLPQFVGLLRLPLLSAIGVRIISPESQARTALKESLLNQDIITDEMVNKYAGPLHTEGARQALLKSAEQIFPENFEAMIQGYKVVHQPALLLWCREDGVVPLWVGERLAKDLPRARLVTIRGCGHLVQEEAAPRMIEEIRSFVR